MNLCNQKQYLKAYTFSFVVMTLIIFSFFLVNGKSFIHESDSWRQHFKAFIFYGEWLKVLLKNFFIYHNFTVPTFTFGMGLGGDLYTNLHFYAIGDIFNVLAVAFPVKYQWILYNALIILRFYLAGIAFSCYCLYMYPQKENAILAGTWVYAFCGFALFASLCHPFFMNPMIYFPLLLLGVEKVFKENRPYFFIGVVFFAGISNFYFFYMLAIMTLLYILLKLFFCVKDLEKVTFCLLKFSMYFVIGTLLGSFILYPTILHALSDARLSSGYEYSSFLYPLNYYRFFLNYFSGHGRLGYWNYMGYGGFALFSIFVFFANKNKQDRVLKYWFILLTAFLLIPMAGLLLNGFSYVTNRWIWAYSFVVALIVVITWENLYTIEWAEKKKISFFFLGYVVINVLFENAFTSSGIVQLVLAAAVFLCIAFRERVSLLCKADNFTKLLSCFVMISVIVNAFFLYAPFGEGYIKRFPFGFKDVYSRLMDNEVNALKTINSKNDFVRFTAPGHSLTTNANLLYGISSTQYYWSLANNKIVSYYKDMSLLDNNIHSLVSFDERTMLNGTASVKYYLSKNTHFLPFGYKLLKRNEYKDISFYENQHALPLGYTYNRYITPEEYNQMDSVQKQQAVLQGVAIEGEAVKGKFKKAKIKFEDSDIPYKLTYNKKLVTQVENAFVVTRKNAVVTVDFEGKPDCETYLYIKGLQYKGVNEYDLYEKQGKDSEFDPLDVYRPMDFDKLKEDKKQKIMFDSRYWIEPTLINISATAFSRNMKTGSKVLRYRTPADNWPSGRKDFIINTGYFRKPKNRIQIKFPYLGKYSFDEIKVVCQAFTNYPGYVKKLKENTLTHVNLHNHNRAFATNLVTGDIALGTDKILLLTIPYSKGWSAFVDNKPAKLYQANTMFMALKLNPGHHKIKLEYRTPGLKEGVMLSGLGIISLMGLMYWRRTRLLSV